MSTASPVTSIPRGESVLQRLDEIDRGVDHSDLATDGSDLRARGSAGGGSGDLEHFEHRPIEQTPIVDGLRCARCGRARLVRHGQAGSR